MSEPAMPIEAIGPRDVARLSCQGCPSLKTERWKDYLENDDIDCGTSANCIAANRSITAYWGVFHPIPSWCPALNQKP